MMCCFRPLLNCYDQDDVDLVSLVKPLIIEPDLDNPYNLTLSLEDSLEARVEDVFDLSIEMYENYFKSKRNGFFIEAGASEGLK